jgi:hypothetical protein
MSTGLEQACINFVDCLTESQTWHEIVTRSDISSEELIMRVIGHRPDLCVNKNHFAIFSIPVPFSSTPKHLLCKLTTLIRMRGFESETMSTSYEFKWKSFKLNSLLNCRIDRRVLVQQCVASLKLDKDSFKKQLTDLQHSTNFFVRDLAMELKNTLR